MPRRISLFHSRPLRRARRILLDENHFCRAEIIRKLRDKKAAHVPGETQSAHHFEKKRNRFDGDTRFTASSAPAIFCSAALRYQSKATDKSFLTPRPCS